MTEWLGGRSGGSWLSRFDAAMDLDRVELPFDTGLLDAAIRTPDPE